MIKLMLHFPDGTTQTEDWACVPRIGETVVLDQNYTVLNVSHKIGAGDYFYGANIHLEVAMK